MRVTQVTIKRLLGIEELSLQCGQITKAVGGNGSGKTSILEGIKAALGGGNLAKLRKVDAEEDPEVVLVLDEGRFRVEKSGDKTAVVKERVGKTAAYEDVKRPQTFLDGLFDAELSNPVRFLTAKPDERADLLLEVIPLELDTERLHAELAQVWPIDRAFPEEGHALQVLAEARQVLFDERTGVNRSAKDKASGAYELQKSLPAEFPADPAADAERVGKERDALVGQQAAARAAAEAAYAGAKELATAQFERVAAEVSGSFKANAARVRAQAASDVEAIRAEAERRIADRQAEAEAEVQRKKADGEARIAEEEAAMDRADQTAAEARRVALQAVEARGPDVLVLSERLATLRQTSEELARLRKMKELADRYQVEADNLQAVADALTQAIERVDAEKRGLAKGLPIEGLEVQGKQILVNGIPYDQLNTAQRVRIAVKVATLRAKRQALPVVFVDDAEHLVGEEYQLLLAELEATGVQAFIARAENVPFRVDAESAAPEAPAEAPAPAKVVPMARTSKRRAVLTE